MYDWKKAYLGIKNSGVFSYWMRLVKYFGNKDIDYLDLIEYFMEFEFPRNPLNYLIINRATKGGGARIPPQYMSIALSPLGNITLFDLVRLIKNISQTHTIYAYLCVSLYIKQGDIVNIKVRDYPAAFINLPAWLQIILDRQYRLAKNAFKKDDDFLFFAKNSDLVPRNDIKKAINSIKVQTGLSFGDIVYYTHFYAGMPLHGRIMHGSNDTIHIELDKRRRRNIKSLVSIYEMDEKNKRSFISNGFCLKEVEPGIYLVHTVDGIFIVPFFLMSMPVTGTINGVDEQTYYKWIEPVGYISKETWHTFKNFSALTAHKIKPYKLAWDK